MARSICGLFFKNHDCKLPCIRAAAPRLPLLIKEIILALAGLPKATSERCVIITEMVSADMILLSGIPVNPSANLAPSTNFSLHLSLHNYCHRYSRLILSWTILSFSSIMRLNKLVRITHIEKWDNVPVLWTQTIGPSV